MSSPLDTVEVRQRAARRGWVNLVIGPASMTAAALTFHLPLFAWVVQVSVFVVTYVLLRKRGGPGFAAPTVLGLPPATRRDLLRRLRAGQPISVDEAGLASEFVAQQRRTGMIAPLVLVGLGALILGAELASGSGQTWPTQHRSTLVLLGLVNVGLGLWQAWQFQRVIRRDDL